MANRVTSYVAAVGLLFSATAASGRMPAPIFLKKVNQLLARGAMAFFSPELKRLKAEAEEAGDELQKEHAADLAARRRTTYCSPASKYLGPRELVRGLQAIPAPKLENMDIKQAMQEIFERNYPCPVATTSR